MDGGNGEGWVGALGGDREGWGIYIEGSVGGGDREGGGGIEGEDEKQECLHSVSSPIL